jgi:single-stranded-DNA-specific exonuclease
LPPDLYQARPLPSLRHLPEARWEFRPADPERARRVQSAAGVPPLVARILDARGLESPEDVQEFLAPTLAGIHDPFLLKDMDAAVERVQAAIGRGESICVYGDYDVDGITATAIMKSTFAFLDVPCETYIPHRMTEGYGLRPESVRLLAERGVRLLITVDNGMTAHEAVDEANALGMDVIVTDHHQPNGPSPRALAVINPKQADCCYPFDELCGAGLAFKLAHALLRRASKDPDAARAFLKDLLDLVAVGTVADVAPLIGENRTLVAHGLRILREGRRLGMRSLMDLLPFSGEINSDNLGFTLAPRINAAGRTEHADYALELLLSGDPRQARDLAGLLDRFNEDRRKIESDITAEALSLIDEDSSDPIIVIEQEGWHQGVVGIVASRLLDRYHRPSIVLGIEGDIAKGSARSISGFNMHAALSACSAHLLQFGGHTMAAGLTLKRADIPSFRESLQQYAHSVLREEDMARRIFIDTSATPSEITLETVEQLDRLRPFGAANPKPLIAIDGLGLLEEPRVLKERHLKLRLGSADGIALDAIAFGMAPRRDRLLRNRSTLRVAASLTINNWGGRSRVELELKDFKSGD